MYIQKYQLKHCLVRHWLLGCQHVHNSTSFNDIWFKSFKLSISLINKIMDEIYESTNVVFFSKVKKTKTYYWIGRCFIFQCQKETDYYFSLKYIKLPYGAYKQETERCTVMSHLCFKNLWFWKRKDNYIMAVKVNHLLIEWYVCYN